MLQFKSSFDHSLADQIELHENLANTALLTERDFKSVEHIGITDDTGLLEKLTETQDLIKRRGGHLDALPSDGRLRRGVAQFGNRFFATNTAVSDSDLNFKADLQHVFRHCIGQDQNAPQWQTAGFYRVQCRLQLVFGYAFRFNQQFAQLIRFLRVDIDAAFQHLHAFFKRHAAFTHDLHNFEHVILDDDIVFEQGLTQDYGTQFLIRQMSGHHQHAAQRQASLLCHRYGVFEFLLLQETHVNEQLA